MVRCSAFVVAAKDWPEIVKVGCQAITRQSNFLPTPPHPAAGLQTQLCHVPGVNLANHFSGFFSLHLKKWGKWYET